MRFELAVYSPDARRGVTASGLSVDWSSLAPPGRAARSVGVGESSWLDVTLAGGVPVEVTLGKSIISSFDLYYAIEDDRVIVSDRFAHVARALPPERRTTSDALLVDHLLHRAVAGTETYCDAVRRVGHGAQLRIDLRSGAVAETQAERLALAPEAGSTEDYLDRLDAALIASVGAAAADGDMALFLSGGVDSTLLASYATGAELLHCRVTSPEYARETAYAREAAGHLGRPLTEVTLPEADYLADLEEATDRTGRPPEFAATVLITRGLRCGHARYLNALYADTLLGFGDYVSLLVAPGLAAAPGAARALGTAVAGGARRGMRARLGRALKLSASFGRPVGDLDGFAAIHSGGLASIETASRIFGPDLVRERLARRLAYVDRLGALRRPDSVAAADHIEAAHMLSFFCIDVLPVWRQFSEAYGKATLCPFRDRRVMDAAFSIPEGERYLRGRTLKYLLKRLLARRAPAYRVDQLKLGGVLPIARYLASGPLAALRGRYALPPFLDGLDLAAQAERNRSFLWHAISFAIWRERVMADAGVDAAQPRFTERWSSPDLSRTG